MKNYITEKDPTLSQTRWAILILWMLTIWLIVAIFSQPKPAEQELNGYMQNSTYVWGRIE